MQMFGGRIQVKNYSFTLSDRICHVMNSADDGYASFGMPLEHPHEASNSLMERASLMKYTVSTNDIYRMATNWLVALHIDVAKMEKSKCSPH